MVSEELEIRNEEDKLKFPCKKDFIVIYIFISIFLFLSALYPTIITYFLNIYYPSWKEVLGLELRKEFCIPRDILIIILIAIIVLISWIIYFVVRRYLIYKKITKIQRRLIDKNANIINKTMETIYMKFIAENLSLALDGTKTPETDTKT